MDPNQRFHSLFHESLQALQDQVSQLASFSTVGGERQEATDHILAGISKLQNEVADAAEYTPAYDRKRYSEAIRHLQDKLNETIAKVAPKSRFQFKRGLGTAHVDMGAAENDPRLHPGSMSRHSQSQSQSQPKPASESESESQSFNRNPQAAPGATTSPLEEARRTAVFERAAPPPGEGEGEGEGGGEGGKDYNEELARPGPSTTRKPSFSAAKSIAISDQSGLHIILPSSAGRATAAGWLKSISGCIVDMSVPTTEHAPFPGLILKDIRRSLVVAGRVAGSIHINGVSDSVLVVVAHQVRIHECNNVDIYLHCTSHPIIEDCAGMRFAPLPERYMTDADRSQANLWDQVNDFKWLKSGDSPNWSVLPEDERLGAAIWTDVVPGQPGVSVDETLQKVGVPK